MSNNVAIAVINKNDKHDVSPICFA